MYKTVVHACFCFISLYSTNDCFVLYCIVLFRYADSPNYGAVFGCFWNIGDFYSDITFLFVLYFEVDKYPYLFFASLASTFLPYFASNMCSLYFLYESRQYNIYMSKYVNRYDWLIIFLSAMGGFFSTIEICRSKLFHLQMFNLQLRREKYDQLCGWRFINIICFENLPQITIQCLYLYFGSIENNNSNSNLNLVVINAMLFSILSLMLGFVRAINKCARKNTDANVRYMYRKKKNYKILIHSEYVRRWHQFTANTLEGILCQVLGLDDASNSIQIFYVFLKRQGIVGFMEVNNLSFKLNEKTDEEYNSIFDKFEKLFKGSSLTPNLKHDLIVKLNLKDKNWNKKNQSKLKKHSSMERESQGGEGDHDGQEGVDLDSIWIEIHEIPDGLEYNRAMAKISIADSSRNGTRANSTVASPSQQSPLPTQQIPGWNSVGSGSNIMMTQHKFSQASNGGPGSPVSQASQGAQMAEIGGVTNSPLS